ncbi:hypothetical protein Tco_0070633 [Tanacetum coccineum]
MDTKRHHIIHLLPEATAKIEDGSCQAGSSDWLKGNAGVIFTKDDRRNERKFDLRRGTLAFGDRDQGFDPYYLQGRRSFSIFGRTGSSLSTLDSETAMVIPENNKQSTGLGFGKGQIETSAEWLRNKYTGLFMGEDGNLYKLFLVEFETAWTSDRSRSDGMSYKVAVINVADYID